MLPFATSGEIIPKNYFIINILNMLKDQSFKTGICLFSLHKCGYGTQTETFTQKTYPKKTTKINSATRAGKYQFFEF